MFVLLLAERESLHMKKFLIYILVAAITMSLCGCGKDDGSGDDAHGKASESSGASVTTELIAEDVDGYDVTVYDSVLEYYYNILAGNTEFSFDDEEYLNNYDRLGWLYDAMKIEDVDERLNTYGYKIMNLTRDEVPELIIGTFPTMKEYSEASPVMNIYTVKDGEPYFIAGGGGNDRLFIINDDSIFFTGSDGDDFYYYGRYIFSFDGTGKLWRDYYYSAETENGRLGYYYNTVGGPGLAWSERITQAKYDVNSLSDNIQSRLVSIDFNLFSTLSGRYEKAD